MIPRMILLLVCLLVSIVVRVTGASTREGRAVWSVLFEQRFSIIYTPPHSHVTAQVPSQRAVKVRLQVLKRSTFERTANGPVLIGPQSTPEFEWRVVNHTGNPVEIPSLDAVLRLHVSAGGREIPVRTEWASTMTLQSGPVDHRLVSDPQAVGAMTLPDGSRFWVRIISRVQGLFSERVGRRQ